MYAAAATLVRLIERDEDIKQGDLRTIRAALAKADGEVKP